MSSEETPREAPPGAILDPDSAQALIVELSGLQRVVYTVRLYGIGHEHARDYADETLQQIQPRLQQYGVVQLDVSDGSIDFQGVPVITDAPTGGLADELHRDGIRSLSLKSGLTTDEFLELLAILGTNFHLPQHQEDTLQGLLWAADLPHVDYEAVQGIEEAVEDSADAGRGDQVDVGMVCKSILDGEADDMARSGQALLGDLLGDADLPRPTTPLLPSLDPDDEVFARGGDDERVTADAIGVDPDHTTLDDGDDETQVSDDDVETHASADAVDTRLSGDDEDGRDTVDDEHAEETSVEARRRALKARFGGGTDIHRLQPSASLQAVEFVAGRQEHIDVPAEDLLALWEEADGDTAPALLDVTVGILAHSAMQGDAGIDLPSTAPMLVSLVEHAAGAGLVQRYRATVDALSELAADAGGEDPQDRALLDTLLSPELVLRYARHVDKDDAGAARALEHVIDHGGPSLAMTLLEQASSIDDDTLRAYLVQRAIVALDGDPRPLVDAIHRLEGPDLRVRVEALARMDSFTARDQLAALLTHANPSVRVTVVERIPSSHLRAIWKRVATMLAEDTDVAVRMAVIRRLSAEQLPVLVPLLSRMVTAESFHRREPEEKWLALETLAREGADDAVATLGELLAQKVRIASPRISETRRLVAKALSGMRGMAARTLLKRAAQSLNPGLRRAAREALEAQERLRS